MIPELLLLVADSAYIVPTKERYDIVYSFHSSLVLVIFTLLQISFQKSQPVPPLQMVIRAALGFFGAAFCLNFPNIGPASFRPSFNVLGSHNDLR